MSEPAPGHTQRAVQAGHRHAAGALNVVVVTEDAVLVLGEQAQRLRALPVLEVDAAAGEDLVHGLHELLDEGVELLGREARLAQAQVKRIVEQLVVVGPAVEEDGEQRGRRHRCARGIELQLADRDSHSIRAEVAEAEDALPGAHAEESDVALGPVAEHVPQMPLAFYRYVEAAPRR